VRRARSWRPATVGPLAVLFAGHLDNAPQIAAMLGVPSPAAGDHHALAMLYGAALLTWSEQTDLRLIGEYAAIALDEAQDRLRLARSPLRAPPLHYHAAAERVLASTTLGVIFACGVEQRLNDAKLADMACFNSSNEARGWFEHVSRVPLGSVVELSPSGETIRAYYDFDAIPRQPRMPVAERVEQAHLLLAEGTRAALAGSKRPALMLSGGLDSSLVAVKALEVLPAQAQLNSYTVVVEPGWVRYEHPRRITDERPLVEAFCAKHPRLKPHYLDNADRGLDYRLNELFFATGSAPQGIANLGVYHSLWEAARSDGCDRVLLGEFGNITVSTDANWAFSEYLIGLRWRQLYLALRDAPEDGRSIVRRLLALAVFPFLPDSLWQWQRRLRKVPNLYHQASSLKADYAEQSGAWARSRAAGQPNPRFPLRDRLATMREVHSNTWGEFSDIYAGFTQIYGMEQRDPTAYRPFFEFCAGLPSDTFLRDGQDRWLAREMLRGQMPEEARLEKRTGRHNADWHAKLTRQREGLLREVDALGRVPRLAEMLDLERVRAALEDWPATGAIPEADRMACEVVVPRAIIMARFVNYVEGRNLEL
jgi:asparagine synthase (glutamine-hydrolysing)